MPDNDKTIRRVLLFFLLISVVLLVVAVGSVRNINRSIASNDWVNHTHAVILEAEALRSDLAISDGALRTYVMSGDDHDLTACREALSDAAERLENIGALTRNETVQSQQVGQLAPLVERHATFVRGVLAARQSGNTSGVHTMLAADAGGTALRDIARRLEKLKEDEMDLLADRDTASYLQAQTTRWTVWVGVALDVLLLAGVSWVIRDDIVARRRVATALREANDLLEARVRERTSELATSNTRLATENLERRWNSLALEHQLRYNLLIIDSISDLVFVLTKAMNISRVNPAVVHVTGWEPPDLVHRTLSSVVQLADAPGPDAEMIDPISRALKEGRDLRDRPALLQDKRGRKFPVRFTLFPLRDRDKVVGGVAVIQVIHSSDLPKT